MAVQCGATCCVCIWTGHCARGAAPPACSSCMRRRNRNDDSARWTLDSARLLNAQDCNDRSLCTSGCDNARRSTRLRACRQDPHRLGSCEGASATESCGGCRHQHSSNRAGLTADVLAAWPAPNSFLARRTGSRAGSPVPAQRRQMQHLCCCARQPSWQHPGPEHATGSPL